MRIGMLLLLGFLYGGLIWQAIKAWREKNKLKTIIFASLLFIATVFSVLIFLNYW